MNINELSFGKAIILNSNLVEIIVDEGIEMDLAMITEYHNWISKNLSDPCMVLINKINSYTYSFDAQLVLGSRPARPRNQVHHQPSAYHGNH